MASSYVVLRCRAFRSFFSLLGFTWLPPAIYRKNNWVCERDKWQVRSHLKPAKGVGWQKLIRIHCPLSNCKLFMIPRSPPPSSTSFFYSDGLSKSYMASFSITSFQNSLLTVLRDLIIKVSFKVKKNWFGRNHVLECNGWGRSPITRMGVHWRSSGCPFIMFSRSEVR
jgi:hypothetical protein